MLESQYELMAPLGTGGMGVVYRARQRATGRLVAVKVMNQEAAGNSLLRARFEQEFTSAMRLQHPHIVQVLACDMQCEHPYIAMELIEGQSLGERINREGPLPDEEALRIISQIASAVGMAHEHHLVHRDIKPDNILLTREGRAKLTDLGLVKNLNAHINLTWNGTGLGTIAYVAPEQFENAKTADIRSDVYGLGATLYHALTGLAPFRGGVSLVILKKKLTNDFVRPLALNPSLHPAIDQAICKALDSNPDNRQQSCEEFLASLPILPIASEAGIEEQTDALPDDDPDRRRAFRFPAVTSVACGALLNTGSRSRGEMLDISLTGVQLRLPRRFEPGAVLSVDVIDEQELPTLALWVKVRWVKKIAQDDWALGCAFDRELSDDDLNKLLGNPLSTVVLRQSEYQLETDEHITFPA